MHIETDYLIVGGGASGMAFADTLLTDTDAKIVIVDRGHSPGGHWNHAYPFVRLHQPSAFYGVASRELGQNSIETYGGNKGLCELANGSEICGYLQQVLHHRFLPSGRVQYLSNSEFTKDGTINCALSGETHTVNIRKKTVYSAHSAGTIPATHKRKFTVGKGVDCISSRDLAGRNEAAPQYVIVGSGKTAIDTCLWLLERGVEADKIIWIMPRDAWFLNRGFFQPALEHYDWRVQSAVDENQAILDASSVDDLFERLAETGNLLRFDESVKPTAYKCATVTELELEKLRQIKNVVRMGHLKRVDIGQITLDKGVYETDVNALYVDCTASGLSARSTVPVFADGKITIQCVRTCQPTFSAAFIAHIEASLTDDATKNKYCRPIPYPKDREDWLSMLASSSQNQFTWMNDPDLRNWLKTCRLDALTTAEAPVEKSIKQQAMIQRFKETIFPAAVKLQELMKKEAAE